ncbi:MAG TPA: flavin reductase [Spirochaetota bacterium]|nr:flavin reductase [Spirochaetota bacterium]HPP05612.1 flavin reductase [Spirochaetota bacterium]
MNKENLSLFSQNIPNIINKLPTPGALLLCGTPKERENLITIGWINFGIIWNEPVVEILIRPSRFSYELLNKHNEFTINVMSENFKDKLDFCGRLSGRYVDKFQETKLVKINSKEILTSSLKDALFTLECRIIFKREISPENLSDIIRAKFYQNNDYHTIFTANILHFKYNIERSFNEPDSKRDE